MVLLVAVPLRVPPLVALLLTGLLIGPSGIGWISDREEVEAFAEIGVVLLLFTIGLEISLEKLRELRRPFLIGGSVQAAVTTLVATAIGLAAGLDRGQAVLLGFVIALSSTAIVLKLYADRGESETPQGRSVLGILLFQDLLIVPMIVLVPVLAGEAGSTASDLLLRFSGSLVAIVAIVVVARRVAPFVFDRIAGGRARELLLLGSLALCLALAWLTHSLGLSTALGAFVAGLLIGETEYAHQAMADIGPFRDLFVSIFFISVGMLVDLDYASAHLPLIVLAALAVILIKSFITGGAVAAVGLPNRTRFLVGMGLAQVGEFSFLLMEVGRSHGLLGGEIYQLLLSSIVLTMLATPLLIQVAPLAADGWTRLWWVRAEAGAEAPPDGLRDHVIILGFGAGGRLIARVLREVRIPFVAVDLDAAAVKAARGAGEPVQYGDATRREVLRQAGIGRARLVVFVLSDPSALPRAVRLARELNPAAELIVRTRRVQEIESIRRGGANEVVAEEFETAIEIFTLVLRRYHVPRNIVRAQTRLLRGEGYRMLRSPTLAGEAPEALLRALEMGTTDVFRLEQGSPAVGRTLQDLEFRRRTGATVLAVVRGEEGVPNPPGGMRLIAGDDLVLVGSHEEVERGFDLLAGRLESGQDSGPVP